MTLDWWSLGLQAINFLILAWLLGRVFWRPVAGAIARRQQAAQELLDAGETAQAQADAALAEVRQARDGIAAERDSMRAEAQAAAKAASTATQAQAQARADALLAEARDTIARERDAAQADNAAQAAALSIEMAARILTQFNTAGVRAGFLDRLVAAIAGLSPTDRAALVAPGGAIAIVTPTAPDDAERARIERTVSDALGDAPDLRFAVDPEMIAGLELRSPHFVLHNSWRTDLDTLLQEVKNAA